jgi:hypothetical protein
LLVDQTAQEARNFEVKEAQTAGKCKNKLSFFSSFVSISGWIYVFSQLFAFSFVFANFRIYRKKDKQRRFLMGEVV